MIRTNIHLTTEQTERLKTLAQQTGLKPAELVRRAIDTFLDREERRRKTKDEP
jgi:predicted DNA-binding protein